MTVTDYSDDFDWDDDDINQVGGNYVNAPCWAQILITSVDEEPIDKKQNPIDAIQLKGKVVASTDDKQVGKSFQENFNTPNASHSDGGSFCFKRLARIALALDLKNEQTQKPVRENKKGDKFAVNWKTAEGRTMIVFIDEEEYEFKDDKTGEKKTRVNHRVSGHQIFFPTDRQAVESGLEIQKQYYETASLESKPKEASGAGEKDSSAVEPSANENKDELEGIF